MFRLMRPGLVFVVVALLLAAGPAVATDYAFSSPMTHVDGPSGTITGEDVGDLALGPFSGPISADIDPNTGIISNGMTTYDFGGGDTLIITFDGQIFSDGTLSGSFTIVDGTGALAGASGGGTFAGTTDLVTYDTDVEGTLTLP
jgi:hypothetical protein